MPRESILDENIWSRAKDEAAKSYSESKEPDAFWGTVNKVYKNMGGRYKNGAVAGASLEAEIANRVFEAACRARDAGIPKDDFDPMDALNALEKDHLSWYGAATTAKEFATQFADIIADAVIIAYEEPMAAQAFKQAFFPGHDYGVCGECGRDVTKEEWSKGESNCCHAPVVSAEEYEVGPREEAPVYEGSGKKYPYEKFVGKDGQYRRSRYAATANEASSTLSEASQILNDVIQAASAKLDPVVVRDGLNNAADAIFEAFDFFVGQGQMDLAKRTSPIHMFVNSQALMPDQLDVQALQQSVVVLEDLKTRLQPVTAMRKEARQTWDEYLTEAMELENVSALEYIISRCPIPEIAESAQVALSTLQPTVKAAKVKLAQDANFEAVLVHLQRAHRALTRQIPNFTWSHPDIVREVNILARSIEDVADEVERVKGLLPPPVAPTGEPIE